MNYFENIRSFAHLKKEYRRLAMRYHPDREGGDEEIMKQVISQFEDLFKYWEHRKGEEGPISGYENDYEGATFEQYVAFVAKEYQWRGRNNKGQSPEEIHQSILQWLSEVYPDYLFDFRLIGRYIFNLYLLSADFIPFTEESNIAGYYHLNNYNITGDDNLTDRAKDVMNNIRLYILSHNSCKGSAEFQYLSTIGKYGIPYKFYIPEKRHMR